MWHSFELHLNTTADGAPIMQCVCVSVTGFVVKCPILRTAQKWVEVIGYIKFPSSEAKGKESVIRTVDCAAPSVSTPSRSGLRSTARGRAWRWCSSPRDNARPVRRARRCPGEAARRSLAGRDCVRRESPLRKCRRLLFFPVFEAPSLYVAGCGCVYLSAFCCCCFDVFFFFFVCVLLVVGDFESCFVC